MQFRILSFLFLVLLTCTWALPVALQRRLEGQDQLLYRKGKDTAFSGGDIGRAKDWNMSKNRKTISEDRTKGLSFTTINPGTPGTYSILASVLESHMKDFEVVFDGGKNSNPVGHVSLAYVGQHPLEVKTLISEVKSLPMNVVVPWKK